MLRTVWILSILLVVIGSLLPAASAPMRAIGLLPVSDKVQHFCAYGSLALFSTFAAPKRTAILIALILILMGVALEFGQRLVPGRAFELGDMAANALGVLAGITLGLFFSFNRTRNVAASELYTESSSG